MYLHMTTDLYLATEDQLEITIHFISYFVHSLVWVFINLSFLDFQNWIEIQALVCNHTRNNVMRNKSIQ